MVHCTFNNCCGGKMNGGDEEDMTVVIYKSVEDFKGYGVQMEKDTMKSNLETQHTVAPNSAWGRCYRLTAVCVLLLCVLLLTAVIVLWIKYNNLTTDINQLQTGYNNLTLERDRLQWESSALQSALVNIGGWRYFSSSIYYISVRRKNWDESRQDCRERAADLVIINNAEEQVFISNLSNRTEAWIGLTDREKEGTFKWVNGSPLTTAFWAVREPNNYNGEDSVITGSRRYRSSMRTWDDNPCNSAAFAICEKKNIELSTWHRH